MSRPMFSRRPRSSPPVDHPSHSATTPFDYIQLPPRSAFKALAGYWETLFHEAIHATEHPSRLNWSRKIKENSYEMGELVSELGACYLSRELGIPAAEENTSSHIGYLAAG